MHPRTEVIQSGKVRNLDVTESLTYQGSPVAPGGGGVTGFTTSVNSTSPNDLVHASVLAANSSTNDVDIVLQTKSQGAIITGLAPNGLASGGDKRGIYAVDLQSSRSGNGQVAAGARSVIGGGQSNQNNGQHAVIAGGFTNYIGTSQSFIGGGQTNSITVGTNAVIGGGNSNLVYNTGSYQTIAGGRANEARDQYTSVGGGYSNYAIGQYSTVSGGWSNSNAGQYATIAGGSNNTNQGSHYATIVGGHYNKLTPNAQWSVVMGYYGVANIRNSVVHGGGVFSSEGDAQAEQIILLATTLGATQAEMATVGVSAGDASAFALPNDSASTFEIQVVARQISTTPGDQSGWLIRGVVRNNGGTSTLVGTPLITNVGATAGATTWAVALGISGARVTISVTGEAGKNIRWVATVKHTRVIC